MASVRLLLITVWVALASCGSASSGENPASLKSLGKARHIEIGTAVGASFLHEPGYAATLKSEFALIVPEAELNIRYVQPSRGRFDFSRADELCDFAVKNGLKVRGHALVWDNRNVPEWLRADRSADEQEAILKNHVQTVIRHFRQKYPGLVQSWIVVNEAIAEDGSILPSLWSKSERRSEKIIKLAFQWARGADPDAKLFYNEKHAEGLNRRSERVYSLMKQMRTENVPVDAVGLQMHISVKKYPSPKDVRDNIQRLAALGLEVGITELDIRVPADPSPNPADLVLQGQLYRSYIEICRESPACKSVVFWGFTDKHSWIRNYFGGHWGHALLFNDSYQKKPTYRAVLGALK